MFPKGWARVFRRDSGSKRRHGRWLLAVSAVFIAASLPVLWSAYPRPEPQPVQRAALPAISPGPSAPSYDGGRSAGARSEQGRPDRAPAASDANCDDLKVLVDRSHALPPDYAPRDLVSLRDLGVPTLGSDQSLRREAGENLVRLVSAAAGSGEELVVASAYRSYEDQRFSHARMVSIYGRDADRTSATPGRSQHQLGTAVDFTNGAAGYQVHPSFGRTTASRWLRAHAHEHGFVLAYPPGKEAETGYSWEPWHYRYVGPENARRIEESHLGLQGFLQQNGVPPRC